jgi:hypothetical protein
MNDTKQTIIEDGIEYEVYIADNGNIDWTMNNKPHRIKGPARIWNDGIKHWFINMVEISEQAHTKIRTMLTLGLNKV